MNYKATDTEPEDDDGSIGISSDSSLVEDELSFDDFTTDDDGNDSGDEAILFEEELRERDPKKSKNQTKTFSLQARRAIEDHLEQRRLRKELDYLFDDDFASNVEIKDK